MWNLGFFLSKEKTRVIRIFNLKNGTRYFFSLIAYISKKYIRQRKVDNHNNRESAWTRSQRSQFTDFCREREIRGSYKEKEKCECLRYCLGLEYNWQYLNPKAALIQSLKLISWVKDHCSGRKGTQVTLLEST